MDVRKITLSPNIAHQLSTSHRLLLWMQNNERHCKGTNIAQLARTAAMHLDHANFQTLRTTLNTMVNNQVLHRKGGKRKADFTINYMHKDIPSDVLEKAPLDTQKRVKQALVSMQEGQYLSDDGCIVTPGPEEPKEQPNEATPASQQDTPVEQVIKAPLTVTKDGLTININLTIKL